MVDDRLEILRVAVAAPLPHLFDYLPPVETDDSPILPGMRVLVPFGNRTRVGMVVALARQSSQAPERLKPIESVLDARPLLGEEDLALVMWAVSYYRYAPGEGLFTALPSRARHGESLTASGEAGWRLTALGRSEPESALVRAPKQGRIVALLRAYEQGLSSARIRLLLGDSNAALRALKQRGWAEPCQLQRGLVEEPTPAPGPPLNERQRQAVDAVTKSLGRFRPFLLDGVTGSGKTEVYIQLLLATLAAGRQALVLVPEIGLTPQLQRRLRERVSGAMATLHSGLGTRERQHAWQEAAAGNVSLVLGTRSAIFVPMPRLGLIVVDEEHDLSFKQQEGFRYSARDLAVRRAQQRACPVVLGSATPSLETLQNAESGRYERLELPERAGDAHPPELVLLDIRAQPLRGGLSPVLVRLMREQLAAGCQILLFLNRRGFAPLLTCYDCGWVGDCPRCDARLTLHLSDDRLWCHHCGLSRPAPRGCPDCKGTNLRPLGQGTERLETELRELFPGVPLARVDRDSTRRKGELDRLLAAIRAGDYPLLLGTQMLAKGHHFPDVTLVGILDVDQGLFGADYRAPERMAQLVIQVAGRAGRALRPGRVVLQTRHPDHPLLLTLRQRGYRAFASAALAERRAAALPPFSHQALLRAECQDRESTTDFLHRALKEARELAGADIDLFGPVPAPMERRAGRYRAQLLVQSPQRCLLQQFLSAWTPLLYTLKGRSRVRWSLDVDPQEML